jgi:hypothetical protein
MRDPRPCIPAFNQFAASTQDAIDNKAFAAKGTLTMPVLAIGADKSTAIADEPCFVATDATSGVISKAGHWMMKTSRPRPPASSTRNSNEINGSGQRRDLGYQGSDFIH